MTGTPIFASCSTRSICGPSNLTACALPSFMKRIAFSIPRSTEPPYVPNGMSPMISALCAPRATARVWCSISSTETGIVVSYPRMTCASESPTSRTGTPASSRIWAVGKSYAVSITNFSPRALYAARSWIETDIAGSPSSRPRGVHGLAALVTNCASSRMRAPGGLVGHRSGHVPDRDHPDHVAAVDDGEVAKPSVDHRPQRVFDVGTRVRRRRIFRHPLDDRPPGRVVLARERAHDVSLGQDAYQAVVFAHDDGSHMPLAHHRGRLTERRLRLDDRQRLAHDLRDLHRRLLPVTRSGTSTGCRKRFVIGNRRSLPNARAVIFTPGGACRRLYSLRSTISTTLRTVFSSYPNAIISRIERSSSTYACRIGSSSSYGGSSSWSVWPGRSSADGGFVKTRWGIAARPYEFRHADSSYTSVFGTSFSTAKPPAMSPYSVEYPVAISLLFPVVNTRWPNLFDSAINIVPRIRAWRFSSANPGFVPANVSASVSRNARWM